MPRRKHHRLGVPGDERALWLNSARPSSLPTSCLLPCPLSLLATFKPFSGIPAGDLQLVPGLSQGALAATIQSSSNSIMVLRVLAPPIQLISMQEAL
ncbi:hypothetical protein CERSUDRAFT_87527 [Gelatoporia subvermispora B]|uniref:Uncharacterized protein n=1 Tax=Ceriporiopsis subvermispora (strain B) TaxID=914234 RepID=M2R2S2_CERS8|nr:hypothetical protein CERSUDRAFT_87527 [Gelatoporia subvermispora B]